MGLLSTKARSDSSTQQLDARAVGGDASSVTSQPITIRAGRGVTLNMLDGAAVSKSLDLALAGVEGAQATAAQSVGAAQGILSGALGQVADLSAKHSQALENIKGNDVRALVIVGLLVAAVVGVAALKRGG